MAGVELVPGAVRVSEGRGEGRDNVHREDSGTSSGQYVNTVKYNKYVYKCVG